jgi:Protein of unknown function (DUF3108)
VAHRVVVSLLLVGLWLPGLAARAANDVQTYTATYTAEAKGKELGTAEFSVRFIPERNVYEFKSETAVKGFLKLAVPKPVVQRSEFRVTAAGLEPLEYWYEDGSRSGDGNVHLVFDWQRKVVTTSSKKGRKEFAISPGALDSGTMQVALMHDVATNGKPGRYQLADEDSVTEYVYEDQGAAKTATGMGELTTHAFMQQRQGSSRVNWIWLVPELNFLPARIEQRRNGEVNSAFTLRGVEGIQKTR